MGSRGPPFTADVSDIVIVSSLFSLNEISSVIFQRGVRTASTVVFVSFRTRTLLRLRVPRLNRALSHDGGDYRRDDSCGTRCGPRHRREHVNTRYFRTRVLRPRVSSGSVFSRRTSALALDREQTEQQRETKIPRRRSGYSLPTLAVFSLRVRIHVYTETQNSCVLSRQRL